MPNTTFPSIRGKVTRLTKINNCGVPVTGTKSTLVTEGFISVKPKANYEDGEDTSQKNANGKIAVSDKAPDQFKNLSVDIEFCSVDPEAFNLITGQPLVVDASGASSGVSFGQYDLDQCFAMEVWADVPGGACVAGARPYAYYLFPFIADGKIGDWSIEEKLATFTLSSVTRTGSGWGAGPYNVEMSAGSTPAAGPLITPITAKDHIRIQQVTVAPPAVTAGAVALP